MIAAHRLSTGNAADLSKDADSVVLLVIAAPTTTKPRGNHLHNVRRRPNGPAAILFSPNPRFYRLNVYYGGRSPADYTRWLNNNPPGPAVINDRRINPDFVDFFRFFGVRSRSAAEQICGLIGSFPFV